MNPEIVYELGDNTKNEPFFNEDLTVIHLRLEEDITVTKDPVTVVFDLKISNPDGYFGLASLSSLCPANIWGRVYSSHLSFLRPTFTVQLTPWKPDEEPVVLPAGTPLMMYKYYACDYDDCGHLTCEPRNRLRFERRWNKMSEAQREQWRNRLKRVRCTYKSENPPPIRDAQNEDVAHLCAERDVVVRAGSSALVEFDVQVEIPFGWNVQCMLSELGGLGDSLISGGYEIWQDGAKPLMEVKLQPHLKEFVIRRGVPVCRLEMKKYRCGCPRCYFQQLEPPESQPNHDVDSEPMY